MKKIHSKSCLMQKHLWGAFLGLVSFLCAALVIPLIAYTYDIVSGYTERIAKLEAIYASWEQQGKPSGYDIIPFVRTNRLSPEISVEDRYVQVGDLTTHIIFQLQRRVYKAHPRVFTLCLSDTGDVIAGSQ